MGPSVGIDVHTAELLVAIGEATPVAVERTQPALKRLAKQLQRRQPAIIVGEPRGGDERLVSELLLAAALPVARVNPQQVRWFARRLGIAAKSDPLDARILAPFGQDRAPRPLVTPEPMQQQVAAWSAGRRPRRDDLTAKRHQGAEPPAAIQAIDDRVIATRQPALTQVEHHMADLIAQLPDGPHHQELLLSCPGIGPRTAAMLLAELPELGPRSGKEIACLVGVAPLTQQSGATAGHAQMDGGRRHVRADLWEATLAAIRWNPVIPPCHARLLAAAKPPQVRRTACLRKLLTLLNAMLQHDQS